MDDLIRLLKCVGPAATADLEVDPLLAVATVVNTRGSAYRRPGARMLVHRSLKSKGAVSAGCLERDIIANCESFKQGAADGGQERQKPLLLTYDGTSSDELIFGLKLGCDGIVQVLVEAADAASCFARKVGRLGRLLPKLLAEHKRLVAVTIFDIAPAATSDDIADTYNVGLCMLETGSQTYGLDALPQSVQAVLRRAAQELLLTKNPRSYVLQQEVGGYSISALIEVVEPTTSLLIVGGGQDVQPLAQMGEILGWSVTVISGKQIDVEDHDNGKYVDLTRTIATGNISAAVVMTHDYELDRQILKQLINTQLPYVGVVGPRRRADKLLAELALAGQPITANELARLYSPVGLDIGAEGPEEIALSILSEIKAVLAGHNGGMLRHKQGPIHNPVDRPVNVEVETVEAVSASVGVTKLKLSANCKLDS
ncbi:MAG: XdhC family protein [Cyanobacteria bacterium REEB67]|nr:XdhC family protein [Cyanobacteria bacterium REEB67]